MYRINQDGEKLFNIMIESKKYLKHKPIWQYIVFSYNENHIEQAKKLAKENDISFMTTQSSRWEGDNDPYRPKNKSRYPVVSRERRSRLDEGSGWFPAYLYG